MGGLGGEGVSSECDSRRLLGVGGSGGEGGTSFLRYLRKVRHQPLFSRLRLALQPSMAILVAVRVSSTGFGTHVVCVT